MSEVVGDAEVVGDVDVDGSDDDDGGWLEVVETIVLDVVGVSEGE